jgi:carbonic anhydrase/acetyltransferase-like protein (isoleucine patch superfamily)
MPLYPFENKFPVIHPTTYVHPQAAIIGDVTIGEGCFIGAGAALRGDFGKIRVGPGTSIQENCVLHVGIERTNEIAGNVVIAHGAILHDVAIKQFVLVGMGAIVMSGVVCEDHVIIAAGSVIKDNFHIPANVIVAGNPARIVKALSPEQRERIHRGVETYKDLARRYKEAE